MEGPSLYLAARQLAPFKKKIILEVSGNSKIGINRLERQKVKDIFCWGKHLVFQFNTFALRVHFMLFGSFEAAVNGKPVTGDYKKKNRPPRLSLLFPNGHIEMYSCSLKFLEVKQAKKTYDFSADVMSQYWDPREALKKVISFKKEQIGDVLLNQSVFAGVGNIIKNEILLLACVNPQSIVANIAPEKIKKLVKLAREFSFQFYEWRKRFVLRKHLIIYRKSVCPVCGGKVIRLKTGKLERWSYFCPITQPL